MRTVKAKRRRSKAVTEKARLRASQKFFKPPPGKVLNSLLLTRPAQISLENWDKLHRELWTKR